MFSICKLIPDTLYLVQGAPKQLRLPLSKQTGQYPLNYKKQNRLKDTLQFLRVGGPMPRLTDKYDTSAVRWDHGGVDGLKSPRLLQILHTILRNFKD